MGQQSLGWLGNKRRRSETLAPPCPAAQPHLQIGQLSKRLAAHVALVFDFSILLLQRIRQRLVAHRPHADLHLGEIYGLPV